jgi:large subunit ribosomal protein L29
LKTKEIRALSPEELTKQLETTYQELFELRFRLATKQLVNHREVPRVKKEIAQLKTIIRERELVTRQVSSGKKA